MAAVTGDRRRMIRTMTVEMFVRSIQSWFGAALDGDWSTIGFLAEHPDNPYLVQWGWWDK